MPEFHFMESEWGLHAQRGGKITTVGAVACMIMGFIFGTFWGAMWALVVAIVLATFETPFIFSCLEPCRRLKDILNETLKFKIPAVRGVVYVALSILCFVTASIQILLGILLLLTAILYFFAQIVGATIVDGSDGPAPGTEPAPASGQTPFGTFA